MNLPSGTITFLFTDIEGSSKLWDQRSEPMRDALACHDAIVRRAIESHNGRVFKTVGDAFCAAFHTAPEALAAALAAQRGLQAHEWAEVETLRVRMALHTGEAELRDEDYFGQPLNRVARLLAIGHGGQVLLSDVTHGLVGNLLPEAASLRPMGLHRLKDLQQPELVFQLCHPDLPSGFPPLRSLSPNLTNLPVQITSFIGRNKEMEEVQQLLAETRLLTLTGAGGCGKTRLAQHVAANLVEDYPDGVWLVELAALTAGGLVAQAVASALGIREEPGRSLARTLTDSLRYKTLLLLMDNCEHLAAECAGLADSLLRSCPNMKVVATSREPLNIAGETTYRVPSMLPADPGRLALEEQDLPAALMDYDAVRLFVERARSHRPEFILTSRNAPAVAQVCSRLDGIPLAIELAAARIRAMTVEQVAQRLDDRFRLLTGGSRTALPRQQTLRATIDWSYNQLSEVEQTLFHRLSVFAGGWTLEAAEAVCCGEGIESWEVLDLLTSLVEKSLVLLEEQDAQARYRLLETVRQYGGERLEEVGKQSQVRDKHRDYFLALVQASGSDRKTWLARLEAEHDNLRGALARCLDDADASEAVLGLVTRLVSPHDPYSLFNFWYLRGYWSEGREWLERALQRSSALSDSLRAEVLRATGSMAGYQQDYECAAPLLAESVALWRELGDKRHTAGGLLDLGFMHWQQGDYARATEALQACLAIQRELGAASSMAWTLAYQGGVFYDEGRCTEARAACEESLTLLEGWDTWGRALCLETLAKVALSEAEPVRATALLAESLRLRQELGHKWGMVECLRTFAAVAALREQPRRAAQLYGAAEVLGEASGIPVSPNFRARYDRDLAAVRQALGDGAFASQFAAGRALSWDQAIAYALEEPSDA